MGEAKRRLQAIQNAGPVEQDVLIVNTAARSAEWDKLKHIEKQSGHSIRPGKKHKLGVTGRRISRVDTW